MPITEWEGFIIIVSSTKRPRRPSETPSKSTPLILDAFYSLGYAHEQLGEIEAAEKEFAVYKRLKKKMDSALKKEQEKH